MTEIGLVLQPVLGASVESSERVEVDGADRRILVPSLVTRDVETTVFVDSGQTLVLGGLLRDGETEVDQRVPWLTDIPVIGNVFSQRRGYTETQNLLLFVTPHLVTPEVR